MEMQLSLFDTQMTKKEEQIYQRLARGLEESLERHAHILKHGTNDPFWHDGANLMLVRGHISYYKRKLYDLHLQTTIPLPDIALKPTPPEYPLDYCVNCRPHHR